MAMCKLFSFLNSRCFLTMTYAIARLSIGGSGEGGGGVRDALSSLGSISLFFMQFSAKILPFNMFLLQSRGFGVPVWKILDSLLFSSVNGPWLFRYDTLDCHFWHKRSYLMQKWRDCNTKNVRSSGSRGGAEGAMAPPRPCKNRS